MNHNHALRRMAAALCLLFILLAAGCGGKRPAGEVTFVSCLASLTNVAEFARSPIGEMSLITTYDRSGGNKDWGDLRQLGQNGLYVLADLKGPGCVRRLWMTSVPAEEWLFFFDGEAEPRIRTRGKDFFGKKDPFLPPLGDEVSGGDYSYLPLPYAQSLRIAITVPELKPGMMPFFHIQYETFESSVKVESFPKAPTPAQLQALEQVRAAWRDKRDVVRRAAEACAEKKELIVPPAGGSAAWLERQGGGLLRTFHLRLKPLDGMSAWANARRLREVVLRIYWDGSRDPSVEVPLGDFFGNGLHRREFSSLPIACLGDTYICRFPMPFRKSVRAELQNGSTYPATVEAGYDLVPLDGQDEANYFHASWNSAVGAGTFYPALRVEGRGHYVGCQLTAIGMDGTWNILEGDDLMSRDGEPAPSFHGTGLEDFFNGGWYYSGLFDLPLHGLVEKAPIRTTQYRYLLPDRIPFRKKLALDWEFGDGNRSQGYMSSVSYWYQSAPHGVPVRAPETAARYPQPDPLESTAIMAALFELERVKQFDAAAEMCREYAEKYPTAPWFSAVMLRAAAYREAVEGYGAVSNVYQDCAARTKDPEAAVQATNLMWYHEAATNALLGIHPMGKVRIFLDGKPVVEGDNPAALMGAPVPLEPGEHELTAELSPTRPHGQFSMYLRAHGTNVTADAAWEYSRKCPASWPRSEDSTVQWKLVEEPLCMMPSMTYWQFLPNAYIEMQSGRQLIRPWAGWHDGKATAYLRRRFVIPAM